MSHIVVKKGDIKNLAALQMACERLGLDMVEGAAYEYEPRQHGHDAKYVIKTRPGTCNLGGSWAPQEIGVIEDKNGTYSLAMSPMSGGITSIVGEPLYEKGENIPAPTLLMNYQMCNVALEARKQGHEIEFFTDPLGLQRARVRQPEYA